MDKEEYHRQVVSFFPLYDQKPVIHRFRGCIDHMGVAPSVPNSRFTKAERLLKRSEFTHLAAHGSKIHNRHFICLFDINAISHPRLGVTVSKRVGKATVRNRIKRLCREYFRTRKDAIDRNVDLNIIAKKGVAQLTTAQVFRSLDDIIGRISKWHFQ